MPDTRLDHIVGKSSILPTKEETEIVRKNFKAMLDRLFNSESAYTLEENTQWKDLLADQICFMCRFPMREWRDEETKDHIKLNGINVYVYHKIGYDYYNPSKKYKYFSLSIDPIGAIRRYRCRRWNDRPTLVGRNYDYQMDLNDLDFSEILNIFQPGKIL
jgi:hypothetical protein